MIHFIKGASNALLAGIVFIAVNPTSAEFVELVGVGGKISLAASNLTLGAIAVSITHPGMRWLGFGISNLGNMSGVAIIGSSSAGVNAVTTSQHSIIIDRNETSPENIDDILEDYSYIYDTNSNTSTLEFTSFGINTIYFPRAPQQYMWAIGDEMRDFELETSTYSGGSNSRGVFQTDLSVELKTNPPTQTPSKTPSQTPTEIPSTQPSVTVLPVTATPTETPSTNESAIPTQTPTANQTDVPTIVPTSNSTDIPTIIPTSNATMVPSILPTDSPRRPSSGFGAMVHDGMAVQIYAEPENEGNFMFNITIDRDAWIGVGFSPTSKMPGSFAVIAIADGGVGSSNTLQSEGVFEYAITDRKQSAIRKYQPTTTTTTPSNFTNLRNIEFTTTPTSSNLIFTTERIGDVTIDPKGESTLLFAHGTSRVFAQHGIRQYSLQRIDWVTFEGTRLGVRTPSLVLLHATLMLFAWMVLYPIGILLAASWQSSSKTVSSRWLLRAHIYTQLAGFALTLIAFVLIVGHVQGSNPGRHFGSPHKNLGLLLVLALFAQVGFASCRPKPALKVLKEKPSIGRRIWETAHKVMGYMLVGLGIITCFMGSVIELSETNSYNSYAGFVVACSASLVLSAVIAHRVLMLKQVHRPTYSSTRETTADEEYFGTRFFHRDGNTPLSYGPESPLQRTPITGAASQSPQDSQGGESADERGGRSDIHSGMKRDGPSPPTPSPAVHMELVGRCVDVRDVTLS